MACNIYSEKQFKIEEGLIEESTCNIKLGISFSAPAGFMGISEGYCDSLAQADARQNPFGPRLSAVFIDTLVNNATMSVWDVRCVPQEQLENKLDFYKTEFNLNNEWSSIERDDYRYGCFPHIIELNMSNSQTHLRRVYFYNESKPWFYVDYIVPEAYYNDMKPFIDSSLGTFSEKIDFTITTDAEL